MQFTRIKRTLAMLLALLLACSLVIMTACDKGGEADPAETTAPVGDDTDTDSGSDTDPGADTEPLPEFNSVNGNPLEDYQIVYAEDDESFNKIAAEYVASNIEAITGVELPVAAEADSTERDCEILVGLTGRDACKGLDEADIADDEFVIFSSDKKVVLYGYEQMIAGAAYRFVADSFTAEVCAVKVPEAMTSQKHIPAEEVNHVILVIGDGMGPNHEAFAKQYYDDDPGRGDFISYPDTRIFPVLFRYFPNQGTIATCNIYGSITDSAAASTALATGYKTRNKRLGVNPDGDVNYQNLTELAAELGWKSAVLTTDKATGATPSGFTVHVKKRSKTKDIKAQQETMAVDSFLYEFDTGVVDTVRQSFETVGDSKFFMMYEEAHIDKCSHSNNDGMLFYNFGRMNHAMRAIIEYVLYHPDTILLVTADHECGGVKVGEDGRYLFTLDNHSGVDVDIFALGAGTEVFNGCNHDNTFIPKFIANVMGREYGTFGNPDLPVEPDERYIVPEEYSEDPDWAETDERGNKIEPETDENGDPVEPEETNAAA